MKDNVTKNLPFLALGFFVVAVLLMLAFLLWPTWRGILQVSNQIVADRTGAVSMQQQDAAVADFKSKFPVYQAGLEMIDAVAVDAQNPVPFFQFIETTATMFNVSADIRLAQKTDVKPDPNTFEILIRESQFANVLKFSKALENGPYEVNIQKIDVKTAATAAAGPRPGGEKAQSKLTFVDANIIIMTLPK